MTTHYTPPTVGTVLHWCDGHGHPLSGPFVRVDGYHWIAQQRIGVARLHPCNVTIERPTA